MPTLAAAVDVLQLVGEPTRVRLMALLDGQELTVAEIVAVTGLAQSSVSTHLGRLREAVLVRDRKAGSSTFYTLNDAGMPEPARRLWEVVRAEVHDATLEEDRERSEKVVRSRDQAGLWPDVAAGEMDRHWSPGRTWESLARVVAGLVRLGDVVDIGCGDGSVAQLLRWRARSWTCVDRSARVLSAARDRLAAVKGVTFIEGDAHALPLGDAAFDAALLLHVLTQVKQPATVITEAARVLRPGGLLAVAALESHDQAEATAAYGDVQPGFAVPALRRLLLRGGFEVESCEVSCRDRRPPHYRVITAFATRGRRPPAPRA
ncbi:MAG TPA: metalloregulator ArsR/SmtB family transcription factor [Polyangiaceae bacterium]|nr:metalloregulator ArsR/SmtB family transcription factor [Polyangiaceae bacterium]